MVENKKIHPSKSPSRRCIRQPSNPPRIPILIPDLLLHLSIRQRFQERRPIITFTGRPKGHLHRRQRCLTERIRPLVPGQLSSDRVSNRRHKLPTQTQFGAQFQCELFGVVLLLGHVPFDLIDEGGVAHVNV